MPNMSIKNQLRQRRVPNRLLVPISRFIYKSMGMFKFTSKFMGVILFKNINVLINEPNFQKPKMNLNLYPIKDYNKKHLSPELKNEPKRSQKIKG